MQAAGRFEALSELFQITHNKPSTPVCSLSGEVRDRTIWAYWAQGYEEMPELFKLCVATWQRHNPHWDVRVLSKASVFDYLSEAELPNRFMHIFSHQAASDCVRLALLSRYGGIYMDVSILVLSDLDALCWDAIASGRKAAGVFFHPHFGTEAFRHQDLTESWFLATQPGNPFFLRWRDLLCELLHNRLDTEGLLHHPLYQGIDLSGIDRLNKQFVGLTFDFREYLFIHAMCHRLIETDSVARQQWHDDFHRMDAAKTAFRVQLYAERAGRAAAEFFVNPDLPTDGLLQDVPLIKFTTPHYGPLLALSREQLLHRGHLLGRLLSKSRHSARPSAHSAASFAAGGLRGARGIHTLTAAVCTGIFLGVYAAS